MNVYFMTLINNTNPNMFAAVLITDVLPIHVFIPLSGYHFQYICDPTVLESYRSFTESSPLATVNPTCFSNGTEKNEIYPNYNCRVMDYSIGLGKTLIF